MGPIDKRLILANLPEEYCGPRVLLRTYRAGDGPMLWDAVEESREHIEAWLPWSPYHQSPDDSEAYARKCHAQWLLREDFAISIWERASGRFLGGSGMHPKNRSTPAFEIGYWIRKSEEGKGYVSETVRRLTDALFADMGANRVYIRCAVKNVRSNAVPQRLGFPLEGMLKNEICLASGELSDAYQYAVTPEIWASLSDRPS